MDPDTIVAQRVAVLRGEVLDRGTGPLPGVEITVLDHPEYGHTLTRQDGMFDMVVNGGGPLTLVYEKPGYLTAQRQLTVPWEDYVWSPDVVLVPLDQQVTEIDLTAGIPMQIAQGSPVTDADGSRQATVLIPDGVQAEMVMPDGSTQPLNTLSVRATEYTVGDSGAAAMPAMLPPTSGYTYAVEWTVDEALAVGATQVRFDATVYFYVEDFIGFPVGTAVPAGYYDRTLGQWIASENGRVVEVIDVTAGRADLDTDGDGFADDAATLALLEITDVEREQLAQLYDAGQIVWRTPLTHFTPWDCNWPYGPPPDARRPNPRPPYSPNVREDENCDDLGYSVIACPSQTLTESVALVGTDLNLAYASDRTSAFLPSLTIPLTGDTFPDSLLAIRLSIAIAGRTYEEVFTPQPYLSHQFVWDRLDAYGRTVQGSQPVEVQIEYVYPAYYYPVSSEFAASFAAVRGPAGSGGGTVAVIPMCANQQVSVANTWHGTLAVWDAPLDELGGWTLNVHHAYDPADETLYLGNGARRSTSSVAFEVIDTAVVSPPNIIYPWLTLMPTGLAASEDGSVYIADQNPYGNHIWRLDPDGSRHSVLGGQFEGFSPQGLALGPDGSLYIAESGMHRVRRLRPDGTVSIVAGSGVPGYSGDGGLATEANLNWPFDVTVAADGGLYIADQSNHCIRYVGPDGTIRTIAGTGQSGFAGDGGRAVDAQLHTPSGVAIADDGTLYVADTYNDRVRVIYTDGMIDTIAGNGQNGDAGDGGLADLAQLSNPRDVVVGPDGTIYIADSGNHLIRHVSGQNVIRTIAGSGTAGYSGDSGPATQADLDSPHHLTLGPNGKLYLSEYSHYAVREIRSPWPRGGLADIYIPSTDGGEVYHFDSSGRHLRTLNGLTAATMYEFSYDDSGRLIYVTDAFGNQTTVERDADGVPTEIVGHDGARTILALSDEGLLANVTNPANESYGFQYGPGGLLTNKLNPMQNEYQFEYADSGLLVRADDPGGSFVELARTLTDYGYQVARTTAEGRATTYSVERLPTGEIRIAKSSGCCGGDLKEVLVGTDGSRLTSYADGTLISESDAPDPRWGVLAPLLAEKTVTLPSGLQFHEQFSRTVSLANTNDLFSLITLTDTATVNGRQYVTSFDTTSNLLIATTPEGRQTRAYTDSLGRPLQLLMDGVPYGAAYTYDLRGRLESVVIGPGDDSMIDRTFQLEYNDSGYVERLVDQSGQFVTYAYDDAGRFISQTLTDGRQVVFGYDANGNITELTPPDQPTHRFSYTPNNLIESYTPPSVSGVPDPATVYEYNLDRQLDLVTRPDGISVDLEFQTATDRMSKLVLPDGKDIIYEYYDGSESGEPETGQLAGISVPTENVDLTYSYDGALLLEESWQGVVQGLVGRTYTADFLEQSLYVNSEDFFAIEYTYDNDLLLSQATASLPGLLSDSTFVMTRDSIGDLLTQTEVDAISTSHQYNSFGELASTSLIVDGNSIREYVYDKDGLPRDARGRIVDLAMSEDGVTTAFHYVYDEADRLNEVWVDGVPVAEYSYDQNGNRIAQVDARRGINITGDDTEYDDQDRLMRYGSTTFTYTANGELQSRTFNAATTFYEYDALGMLNAVTLEDGQGIEYVTDGVGRQVAKRVNGDLVRGFLYQDSWRPVAELDADGDVVSLFMYATHDNVPDVMLSKKEDGQSWQVYRLLTDHLGSPVLIVNVSSGNVVREITYDEFGSVLEDTSPGFQPFGFGGGLYDQHTRLTLFGIRNYDADTGRWTSKDPWRFQGGDANLYSYVLNDPINRRDPLGLASCYCATWECLQQGLRDLKNMDDEMLKDYQEMLDKLLGDIRASRRDMPWDEWLANVAAGFGDALTSIPFTDISLTQLGREAVDAIFDLNGEGMIDFNSAAYQGGYIEGSLFNGGKIGVKLAGGGLLGFTDVIGFSQMFPQTGH